MLINNKLDLSDIAITKINNIIFYISHKLVD